MSQDTYVIPDSDGATFLTNLNAALAAMTSNHAGTARPTYAQAHTIWTDTTATPWVVYYFDGTDDIQIGTVNATTNIFEAANAALSLAISSHASGYVLGATDISKTHLSTATLTATLDNASNFNDGDTFAIHNLSGTTTIARSGTDTISYPGGVSATSLTIAAGASILLTTNGTNKFYANGFTGIAAGTVGATEIDTSEVAALATNNTWTASQRSEQTTLTDGATITPNFNDSNDFAVTLGGNRTMANPSAGIVAGQSGSIFITQDATGSRTLNWGTYWMFPNQTAPTLSTVGGSEDRVDYVVKSATEIQAVHSPDYG